MRSFWNILVLFLQYLQEEVRFGFKLLTKFFFFSLYSCCQLRRPSEFCYSPMKHMKKRQRLLQHKLSLSFSSLKKQKTLDVIYQMCAETSPQRSRCRNQLVPGLTSDWLGGRILAIPPCEYIWASDEWGDWKSIPVLSTAPSSIQIKMSRWMSWCLFLKFTALF